MVELNDYWEGCEIQDTEVSILVKKYEEFIDETQKAYELLKKENLFSWSIISGYYIMFYYALLLLAKNHNLKPKNFEAHSQVINALHFFYSKKEISKLLDIAYHKIEFSLLPGNLLYTGKDIRNKVNYITSSNTTEKIDIDTFHNNTLNQFIEIINKLIEEK